MVRRGRSDVFARDRLPSALQSLGGLARHGATVITLRDLEARLPACLVEPLTRSALFATSSTGLRRLPVSLLAGRTRGGDFPATMLLAGREPWVRYLPEQFFADTPVSRPLGELPVWRLKELVETHGAAADLTVIRIEGRSARWWLRDTEFLAVPEWIGTRIPVPADIESLLQSGGSIRRDMTLVQRHGFEPTLVSDGDALSFFYRRVYRPYTLSRYGDDSYLRSEADLARRLRRGGILWVLERGERVAGALYERSGDALALLALGTLDGDLSLVQRGAIAATYLFTLRRAQELGCATLDLRGCRPSLLDGVLAYKKKWGAVVCEKPETYYDLLLRWNRASKVVVEFFTRNPLVFRNEDGFAALTGAPAEQARLLRMGGINAIFQLTEGGRVQLADD